MGCGASSSKYEGGARGSKGGAGGKSAPKKKGVTDMIHEWTARRAIEEQRERFKKADKDNSGGLDVDEFCNMMRFEKNTLAKRFFDIIDANGDGSITFPELLEVFSKVTMEDRSQFAFHLYDVNGDGGIAKEDLLMIVKEAHQESSKNGSLILNKVMTYLAKADANNDGEVDWKEFQVMWKKFPSVFYPAFAMHSTIAGVADISAKILKEDYPKVYALAKNTPPAWHQVDLSSAEKRKARTTAPNSMEQYMAGVTQKKREAEDEQARRQIEEAERRARRERQREARPKPGDPQQWEADEDARVQAELERMTSMIKGGGPGGSVKVRGRDGGGGMMGMLGLSPGMSLSSMSPMIEVGQTFPPQQGMGYGGGRHGAHASVPEGSGLGGRHSASMMQPKRSPTMGPGMPRHSSPGGHHQPPVPRVRHSQTMNMSSGAYQGMGGMGGMHGGGMGMGPGRSPEAEFSRQMSAMGFVGV